MFRGCVNPDWLVCCAQVYDPAEDSWTAIASMMVPRCEFGLCAVDGRLYAFGGWVGEDIGRYRTGSLPLNKGAASFFFLFYGAKCVTFTLVRYLFIFRTTSIPRIVNSFYLFIPFINL